MILPTTSLMHPTLVARPVQHAVWVYEEKVDGYRMLAYKEGQSIRLVSRRGTDFTRRFPGIVAALRRLDPPTLIFDGEVAIYDPPASAGSAELDLMMNRRTFLGTLAGGLLAAPLAAQAQGRMYRVALLGSGSASVHAYRVEALRAGLRDLGYVEGKNLVIELRWAGGTHDRLSDLAAELVRLKVDVLITGGTPATKAAMQATTTVPIVMVGTGEALRTGLVASLARPGRNVTGLTQLGPEVASKRLQILKDTVPNLSRVAFLWNRANASHLLYLKELQAAARESKLTMQSVEAQAPHDVERALTDMMRERPDALIVTADSTHELRQAWIIDFTAKRRLPALYQLREYVEVGGLMSYGASITEQYRHAATYVDKILKGAKPADLPVEQPTTFELVINLKTAKALGLTIPPSLLQRADQVIE